jgi:hypothetical protein
MYNEPVKWFSFVYSKFSSMGTSFAEYTIPIIWGYDDERKLKKECGRDADAPHRRLPRLRRR